MTKQEVIDLLKSLEIGPYTDSYDMMTLLRAKFGREKARSLFSHSNGASKNCLIFKKEDFVLKWTCGFDYDESMEEVKMYAKAVEQHLEKFFPKTEHLITLNKVAFVLQEKIDCSTYNLPHEERKKYSQISKTASEKKCRKIEQNFQKVGCYGRDLDYLWASMALVLYGTKACKALC